MHNGRTGKPAAIVETDDILVVEVPETTRSTLEGEAIPLDVLFEDEHLLVVNKATGIVIHPAAGNPNGTLVNALIHYCQGLSRIGGVERPGIVHRLDKDTTGVLVVAKNDSTHLSLSLAFQRRNVEKHYVALCYGVPDPREGVVDAPIGRHPKERQRMAISETGRSARTWYRIEERFENASLVDCRPVTGRTHQIRVHLAHIGNAIIGDQLYAGRQWKNFTTRRLQSVCRSFPRQALHARSLSFVHPVTKERLTISAPLPEDMQHLALTLRQGK
jgi:23S rRNA pseudouridine1911/1915/1917 synthase